MDLKLKLPTAADSAQTLEKHAAVHVDKDNGAIYLNEALERLLGLLNLLGICQTPNWKCFLSWLLVIVVSTVTIVHFNELDLVNWTSPICLGVASYVYITSRMSKVGLRTFLLMDREDKHLTEHYVQKISVSSDTLLGLSPLIVVLKLCYEITGREFVMIEVSWIASVTLLSKVILWTYLNMVYLGVCMVFYLVCTLQAINFEEYAESLKGQPNLGLLLKGHICLRNSLRKVSHDFQEFLLLTFLVVTGCMCVTVFITFNYNGSYIDGDLAVTLSVQTIGLNLCLAGVSKIHYNVRNVYVVAIGWHAELTILSSHSNHEAFSSSYRKRDSFVSYLETNSGGISIYGWGLDGTLMCTILVIELSLLLVLLGGLLFGG